MTPNSSRPPRQGFSLIELLCVLAVMSLVAALGVPALAGMGSAGRMRQNLVEATSLLSQARMLALSQNTYAYVFFREDATQGHLEGVVVYSKTGLNVYSNAGTSLPASSGDLALACKRVILNDVRLLQSSTLPASGTGGVARPHPSMVMDLGSDFSLTYLNETYDRSVVFRPTGEVYVAPLAYAGVVEFALEPARSKASPSPLAAVVQVVGATGQARVYRAE